MSAFYAEDFDRWFYLGLIVGGRIDSQSLWTPERWPEWTQSLERIVGSARGDAGVEGCVIRNWDGPPSMSNFVNFSMKQWRQFPPAEGVLGSWDLLAPSNRICAREHRCPDVYASISNLRMARQVVANVQTRVVIAVGADVPLADQLLDEVMLRVSAAIPAMLIAKTRRPWGFDAGSGYREGISETQWLNGRMLAGDLSASVLKEEWEHVRIMGDGNPT